LWQHQQGPPIGNEVAKAVVLEAPSFDDPVVDQQVPHRYLVKFAHSRQEGWQEVGDATPEARTEDVEREGAHHREETQRGHSCS
jgi:hypothetical protein